MKQCISTSALLTSIFIFIALIFMMPISAQAANPSGDYVGYYGDKPSKTSGGQELFSLYVTEKSNYENYRNGTGDFSKAEVAYCFNKSQGWPRNSVDGWWREDLSAGQTRVDGYTLYNKIEHATGAQFADNAPKRLISDENEFRAKILSIGLNGYPYDYSGFNKDANGNKILDDYVFRAITQYAIWHYTDSETIDDTEMGWRGWSENEKKIYKLLVDTTLPTAITNVANSAIDLYLWDGNAAFDGTATIYTDSSNGTIQDTAGNANYVDKYVTPDVDGNVRGYQNLLAVHTEALSTISQIFAETKTLTVSKATTGNLTGAFTFNITLGAGTTYWVNEQTADNVVDDGNGKLTVTLEKDESVSLKILGTSFDYSIEETNASAYSTSIEVKHGTGTVSSTNSKAVSGSNVTSDTLIQYTNTDPNEKTEVPVPIIVKDKEENNLPDAEIELKDPNNNVVDKWTSDETEHISYVKPSTYTLYQTSARRGFRSSRPITFTVDRYGKIWRDGIAVDTIIVVNEPEEYDYDNDDNVTTTPSKETATPAPRSSDGTTVADGENTLEKSPKTADSNNPLLWLGLMVMCAAGTVVLLRRIK
jgi:TQXA domain-containing protein